MVLYMYLSKNINIIDLALLQNLTESHFLYYPAKLFEYPASGCINSNR